MVTMCGNNGHSANGSKRSPKDTLRSQRSPAMDFDRFDCFELPAAQHLGSQFSRDSFRDSQNISWHSKWMKMVRMADDSKRFESKFIKFAFLKGFPPSQSPRKTWSFKSEVEDHTLPIKSIKRPSFTSSDFW